jgi:hypothetical protein
MWQNLIIWEDSRNLPYIIIKLNWVGKTINVLLNWHLFLNNVFLHVFSINICLYNMWFFLKIHVKTTCSKDVLRACNFYMHWFCWNIWKYIISIFSWYCNILYLWCVVIKSWRFDYHIWWRFYYHACIHFKPYK